MIVYRTETKSTSARCFPTNKPTSQQISPVQPYRESSNRNGAYSHRQACRSEVNIFDSDLLLDGFYRPDPIWLIATVEVGGLMGITQQMDQCHSLGLNMPHPHHCSQYLTSQITAQSPHNLQSSRCKYLARSAIFQGMPLNCRAPCRCSTTDRS